jgi:hypothetical protein
MDVGLPVLYGRKDVFVLWDGWSGWTVAVAPGVGARWRDGEAMVTEEDKAGQVHLVGTATSLPLSFYFLLFFFSFWNV